MGADGSLSFDVNRGKAFNLIFLAFAFWFPGNT